MAPGFGGAAGWDPRSQGAQWRAARSALRHGPRRGCSAHFHLFSAFFPSRFVSELAGSGAGARLCCPQPVGSLTRCQVHKELGSAPCRSHLGSPVPVPGDGGAQLSVPGMGAAPSLAPQQGVRGCFGSHLLFLLPPAAPPRPRSCDPQPGEPWHPKERYGSGRLVGGSQEQKKNSLWGHGGMGERNGAVGRGGERASRWDLGFSRGEIPFVSQPAANPSAQGGFAPLQAWG